MSPRRWCWLGVLSCFCGASMLRAQTGEGFDKASLAWRTALHFDPGAEAPLRSLTDLYQREGRTAELLALYTRHVAQYPQDEGASVVLARLYVALKDPQAAAFVEQAIKKQPDSALLRHVLAGLLADTFDARALETLDAAVRLETTVPARRSQWLGELVKAASEAGRDDLVAARMKALVAGQAFSPVQRLQWARRCLEAELKSSAAAVLAGADFSALTGEEAVEARFVQSRVALQNARRAEAAEHARALLDLLAADHWRRKEALLLHWQTADEKQRATALEQSARAWEAAPASETAALAHGDLLMLAGRRDEALDVWEKSLQAQPGSRLIEDRILDGLESFRREDELLVFLAARVQAHPAREDLKLRRARLLLQLGRTEQGLHDLDELLAAGDAALRASTRLQTARWLRLQNLFGEASAVLEAALREAPARWDLRKELAEVYVLLRREPDVEKLFDLDMGAEVTAEVRMEAVQFMITRQMWPLARRHLEAWIKGRPDDFDALLLLARVESLSGRQAAAEQRLEDCRELCDTEARYAAWLAAAWGRATELETTAAFIEKERQRLWPQPGETWDGPRLQRLGLLAEQTMQSNVLAEAERLLRAALADPAVPAESQNELRQRLISVLDGQDNQHKALETEILTVLKTPPAAGGGDLRLRLALMYFDAKRFDLARSTLRDVDAEQCDETTLLQRGIVMARQVQEMPQAVAQARRLVRLQPEEKAHWLNWISLLAETGDESALRLALREMRSRATAWKLGEVAQETLRRHLAASAWRTVSEALASPDRDTGEALLCLGDLEQTEQQPLRRLWLAWARGMLALRTGDETGLADARAAMGTKDGWVVLPDGMSLSLAEARRMLELSRPEAPPRPVESHADYSRPGELVWSFTPVGKAEFQSWCLTPDGRRMLAQDSQGRLYAVDRASGRLLWHRRLESAATPVSAMAMMRGGGEQVTYPKEWCVSNDLFCVLGETGPVCLRVDDGSLVWQLRVPQMPAGSQGAMAVSAGQVLWWRAAVGRLDALSLSSGKLIWTCEIPALSHEEPLNLNNPVWLVSGMRQDGDRVMVWGNGTAVVNARNGSVLWKASVAEENLSFPLQLDAPPPGTQAPSAVGTVFFSSGSSRGPFSGRGGVSRVQFGSALAMPSYGYPGMYGSTQGSSWLQWGGQGERWLQGDGVWLLGENLASARYSVLGFPISGKNVSGSNYYGASMPLGTAGRGLVVVGEHGISKLLPDGQNPRLAVIETRDSTPAKHPMPAAALDGTTVVLAAGDEIRVLDALSGSTLWVQPWPAGAADIHAAARESLKSWHNLRWSARGLALYDGRGRTLMLDWRALMAGGDIILPAGTRALVCLRCGQ